MFVMYLYLRKEQQWWPGCSEWVYLRIVSESTYPVRSQNYLQMNCSFKGLIMQLATRHTQYKNDMPPNEDEKHVKKFRYNLSILKMGNTRHALICDLQYLQSVSISWVMHLGWTLFLVPCGKCSDFLIRRKRLLQYCLPWNSLQKRIAIRYAIIMLITSCHIHNQSV